MSDADYKILNVDKHSSLEDVKRQYKLLALKHHPDREGGSEEIFKQVNKAYEEICNKIENDKRNDEIVDAILREHSTHDNNHKQMSKVEEHVSPSEIHLNLEEIIFGCFKDVLIKRFVECENCNGTGIDNPSLNTIQCRECKGKGTHPRMDFLSCTTCNGKGIFVMNNSKCKSQCQSGKMCNESLINVQINSGSDHGSRIQISDSFIDIKHKYHKHQDGYTLKLDHTNVIAKINITVLDYICGFQKTITIGTEKYYIKSEKAFDLHNVISEKINDKYTLTIRFLLTYDINEDNTLEKIGRSMRTVLKPSLFKTTENAASTPFQYNKIIHVNNY